MRVPTLAILIVLALSTAPALSALDLATDRTVIPVLPPPTVTDTDAAALRDGTLLLERETVDDPDRHLTGLLREAGLLTDGWSIQRYHERTSPLGTHLRYTFVAHGLPVFDHEATLHIDLEGQAWFASHNLDDPLPAVRSQTGDLSPQEALTAARAKVGHPASIVSAVEQGWLFQDQDLVAAWQVDLHIPPSAAEALDVRLRVDGRDGTILSLEDRLVHAREGTGWVFPVSPMVAAKDYGMTDLPLGVDTPEMLEYIEERPFLGLSESPSSAGRLTGDFATVLGSAVSPIDTWLYPRVTLEFQEAMAYWHTDQLQRKIHSLGFTDANNESQLIAAANVPGLANAFYSGGDFIVFGSHAGVFANADAAEDPEVVIHENGHAIQYDQVPFWGGGDQRSMGEGFGDFLGAAVLAEAADGFGLDCVGEWWTSHISNLDPPCLRDMSNDYTYSEWGNRPIHTAGQIWSGHLYDIAQNTSWDTALSLALGGHHLTHGGTTMAQSSDLLILADRELYDGANGLFIAQNAYAREIAGPLALEVLGITPPDPDDPVPTVAYTATSVNATTVDTSGWNELTMGDESIHTLTIPPTQFWDQTVTTLRVSSNGFVAPGEGPHNAGCCERGPIPDERAPNGLIAGIWADLWDPGCGRLAYSVTDALIQVSFEEVLHYNERCVDTLGDPIDYDRVSFRISIVPATGMVEIHLFEQERSGRTTTTGIESPDGLHGIELRRSTAPLAAPVAWRLVPVSLGAEGYAVEEIPAATPPGDDWTVLPLLDDQTAVIGIDPTWFYTDRYDNLTVSSNGLVTFGPDGGTGCCAAGTIPQADGTDNLIAALWADLDPKRCGTVQYRTLSDRTEVAWSGIPYYGAPCAGTEARLVDTWLSIHTDGSLEVHLLRADGGANGTSGIENADGTAGNMTWSGDAALGTPLAWRFTPLETAGPTPDPDPDPDPEPEPEPVEPSTATHHFDGRIACGASLLVLRPNDLCSGLGDASDNRFGLALGPGATAVHLEVTWNASADHAAEALDIDWATPFGLEGASGGSPLIIDQDIDQGLYWIDNGTNATLIVGLAPDQGLVLDQHFHVCVVVRYGGADLPAAPCAAAD